MGKYAQVNDAKVYKSGQYFEPNHQFLVLVSVVKDQEVRESKLGAFIVETKVLKSTCDSVRPSDGRNWFVNLDKPASWGNLKAFGVAATEAVTGEMASENEVTEEVIEHFVSTEQPLAGTILALATVHSKTQKGGDFTKHNWSAPTPAQKQEGEKLAKELGLL